MASEYPLEKNFIAVGAIKIDKDNRYETEIYAGKVSDVLLNLKGFLQGCLMDGSKSQTLPISKNAFYVYANHFISDYKEELERLESEKGEKGIEHITTRLISLMRKRPELDEFANSLPSGDEHRKKLLKKIYLLDQQISSISEGMSLEHLENLRSHSSCEMDLSVLDRIEKYGFTSDQRITAERSKNQN